MKRRLFALIALLNMMLVFQAFLVPAADTHAASTSHMTGKQSHASVKNCVAVIERNGGWGRITNANGALLTLNSVFFGAENNCDVDAINGTWTIAASGTCPRGLTGSGHRVIASGSFGLLPSKDFDKLFGASLTFACRKTTPPYSTGQPLTVQVNFEITANLSGGNSSISYGGEFHAS
jgi:hypothetical protein